MVVGMIGAVIFFPIWIGMGIMAFVNRRDVCKSVYIAEAYVCGFICCIGIFAVGHLAGVFLNQSISVCGRLILGLLIVLMVLSAISIGIRFKKKETASCQIEQRKENFSEKWTVIIPVVVFLLLLGAQVYVIFAAGLSQAPGDITMETVQSFLSTDRIYGVSPLTGRVYDGPPLRYEILCLPTVYTLLCRWFDILPEILLGRLIPLTVLGITYVAYYLLGYALFGNNVAAKEKRIWFLVIVAAVFLVGESQVYMDGHGILYAGYAGTTWRNSILVPATLYASLEKKWWQALLCVLAEVCIVWTLWGLGVCVVLAGGIFMLGHLRRLFEKKRRISSGNKEEENL